MHWFKRSLIKDLQLFAYLAADALGKFPKEVTFVDWRKWARREEFDEKAKELGEAEYFLGQYLLMDETGRYSKKIIKVHEIHETDSPHAS